VKHSINNLKVVNRWVGAQSKEAILGHLTPHLDGATAE